MAAQTPGGGAYVGVEQDFETYYVKSLGMMKSFRVDEDVYGLQSVQECQEFVVPGLWGWLWIAMLRQELCAIESDML